MALRVGDYQCQCNLFWRTAAAEKQLNDFENRAVSLELCKGPASPPTLLANALGSYSGMRTHRRNTNRIGNVSMAHATDSAGGTIDHSGNVAPTMILLQQAGHCNAALGLELLVAPG